MTAARILSRLVGWVLVHFVAQGHAVCRAGLPPAHDWVFRHSTSHPR
jgi:hypothetical protein